MKKYSKHQATRHRNRNTIKYSNKKVVDLNEKDDDMNSSILLAAFLKKNRVGQSFFIFPYALRVGFRGVMTKKRA
jgi:hypothetical protein